MRRAKVFVVCRAPLRPRNHVVDVQVGLALDWFAAQVTDPSMRFQHTRTNRCGDGAIEDTLGPWAIRIGCRGSVDTPIGRVQWLRSVLIGQFDLPKEAIKGGMRSAKERHHGLESYTRQIRGRPVEIELVGDSEEPRMFLQREPVW